MELKIDGKLAELGDSEPAITKKSVDVNNPSGRFIDFSNKFQLPDVETNRKIFQSPKIVGSDNRSFNKLYDVQLSDVFQIFTGYGYLDSSSKNSYDLQIIDRSKELFKALEVKLNSISWDDKDTVLSQTQIDLLDAADVNNCWYWGKLCLHEDAVQVNTDQTTGDARCKYSRPSFLLHALLKAAVENQGYSFVAPEPYLAMSAAHQEFYFTSYQKTLTGNYTPAGTLALTGLTTNDFAHADLTVLTGSINIGTSSTVFRLRGAIESTAVIDIIIRATDNVDATKISESKITLATGTNNVDFSTSEFTSENGYTIDIRFEGSGTVTFTDTLLYTILKDESKDLSTNPWLNYKIKAYDNLPDLTYKDLFTTICVVYNRYQIINTKDKVFEFGTFSNLNKLNTVDWSKKFIIDSDKISSNLSGLGQINYLKYENDITVNRELGQSFFLTDNEYLQKELDYIILKFGASNDVTINSNDIGHISIYNNTTRISDQDLSLRLFEVNVDKLQFNPLNWANLTVNYYQTYLNLLYNIRVIEADFNLNKLDVLNWNEKQMCYVEYFKSIFMILEINNFIPGKKTRVKLLRYGR